MPLAVLDLDLLLHGHEHLEDLVLDAHRLDAVLEVGLDLVLVAGVGVDHVPLLGRAGGGLGGQRCLARQPGRLLRLHVVGGLGGLGLGSRRVVCFGLRLFSFETGLLGSGVGLGGAGQALFERLGVGGVDRLLDRLGDLVLAFVDRVNVGGRDLAGLWLVEIARVLGCLRLDDGIHVGGRLLGHRLLGHRLLGHGRIPARLVGHQSTWSRTAVSAASMKAM